MRKLFDIANLLLLIIFSIFFYVVLATCISLGLNFWLSMAISYFVGSVAYWAAGSLVAKQLLKHSFLTVIFVLAFLLAAELLLRFTLDSSLLRHTFRDVCIWGVIPMLVMYCGRRWWLARKKEMVQRQQGDGSEGLKLDREGIKSQMEQLQGCNQRVKATYDKSCAVKCTTGIFVGKKHKKILSFKGIPYAQQPVGELRWRLPQPLPDSEDVYEAFYYGSQEPQPVRTVAPNAYYHQGEDCLHLNIWANTDYKGSVPRPVLVFFPFLDNVSGGTANLLYEGDRFVEKNPEVIFVNVDFRIGWFGHLDLEELGGEEYQDSCNLGLWDQLAALKWLKANIAAFGGDPENISIMGSTSAVLLPIAAEAQGLFRNAICLQGTGANTLSKEQSGKATQRVLQYFGLQTLEELRALPATALAKGMNELYYEPGAMYVRDGRLLPENIVQAYAEGKAAAVNMLFCTSRDVGRLLLVAVGDAAAQEYLQALKGYLGELSPEQAQALAQYRQKYIRDDSPKLEDKLEFYSYLKFHMPSLLYCKQQALAGGNARFLLWDIPSPVEHFGAYGGVELAFLLGKLKQAESYGVVGDSIFSDVFQKMLVNFLKTGNASLEGNQVKNVDPIYWPSFNAAQPSVMVATEKGFSLGGEAFIHQAELLEIFRQ